MTREQWINEFAARYLLRHPERGVRYSRRQARLRWKTREKEFLYGRNRTRQKVSA